MFLKEIKQKINSTQRISQVTRALELISAVKMRKAQKIALSSRPFAQKVIEILNRLAQYQKGYLKENSFYFQHRKLKKNLVVVVSSDKGFCGSFNKNILKFTEKEAREIEKTAPVEVMAIGKKAVAFFRKKDFKIKVEFTGIGDYGEFEEVKPIARLLLRYFQENQFQKIYLFYADFISSFIQKPKKIQLLPLAPEALQKMLRKSALVSSGSAEDRKTGKFAEREREAEAGGYDYIFEPSREKIFESLTPQLIEFEIYHTILEANASEHSARMMAMRNACQNAKDIIEELTLNYNKVRQNQITSEVSEISSAKQVIK